MLFSYDEEIDNFDDEAQGLSLDGEDDADFDNDFSDDEEPHETAPKVLESQNDDDDNSDKSVPYKPTTEALSRDKLEEVSLTSTFIKPQGALFQFYEQNNQAYKDAVTAYFEEKNYQQAIEKFDEAIADASQRMTRDLTEEQAGEIIAKSMYWQAEACIKTQNIQQAVGIFKALIQNCQRHYLTLAAQRRTEELNTK